MTLIEYTGTGQGDRRRPRRRARTASTSPTSTRTQSAASPIDPGANILRVRLDAPAPGHLRPKGATPTQVPLVPAFRMHHAEPHARPAAGVRLLRTAGAELEPPDGGNS